ncbi:serine hydrolase domain-containing protein [Nocardia sp. NPDC050408]|uniref:serine hydrolase domain-containing protein n=1 Tax=Nocardia sp. NPDC050408 TaxID=3364319 RepID=UPI00379CDEF5
MTAIRGMVAAVLVVLAMPSVARAEEPVDILQAGADAGVASGYPGVIGLVRNGSETRYVHAGYGEISNRTPADPKARLRIGSFTKAFVAVVLLQLEAEHRLSLDDPIDRWIPGAVPDSAGITVRQLLNHTSGLPEYTDDPRISLPYIAGVERWPAWSPQVEVDIALQRGRTGAPGVGFSYANTNYVLASMVITAVTGRHSADEVHERIIEPLQLRDTTYPVTDPNPHGNWLHGYTWQRDISVADPQIYGAAGAMISTLDDFATFTHALFSGRLLPPAQQTELTTTVPTPDAGSGYGLGVLHAQAPCGPVWTYLGRTLGYDNRLVASPDGSRIVLLTGNEFHYLADNASAAGFLDDAATRTFCALYSPTPPPPQAPSAATPSDQQGGR